MPSKKIKDEDQIKTKNRLDKWLWAARFYKTRQLAAEAINGGHVHLNGQRIKPSRVIQIADKLTIHKTPFT
ncbi:MAG: RNA-binding S4 domain-containing protein, partial [Gammaproteobacteria bacterium]|nr:RNA-binding S4 domain-containing protein [Gammaproteobacteria bacterium]